MGTELRVFLRILIETGQNVRRAGWMNWVIISTMVAILSIFGCMFRLTIGIENIVKHFGSTLQVSIYLDDAAKPKNVAAEIKKAENIKAIEFISRDKAWEELKKTYSVPDLSKNPLPNTFHVSFTDTDSIEGAVKGFKAIKGVESVNYPEEITQHIKRISQTVTLATIVLVILLGGLTLFIICNTIQLLIHSFKREIEIMSMMGVTGWYIKTPYILQGSFYGIAGGVLALVPLNILQGYIVKIYQHFNTVPPPIGLNIVVLAILGIGLLVGSAGSLISVQRFLKI